MSIISDIFGDDFLKDRISRDNQPAPASPNMPAINPDHIKRITLNQLIERKDSLVRVNGKTYRFRVTEVEFTR